MKTVSVLVIAALLVSIALPSYGFFVMGRHVVGVIQEVNAQAREAELLQPGKAKALRFTWDNQTKFVANQHSVDATLLSPGARVEVVFHPHFFGSPYVTKVTLMSTPIRHDRK
jgi:Tfp pilus assembly protein PilE